MRIRKRFFGSAICLVLAVSVAACAKDETPTASSGATSAGGFDKSVEIRWATQWGTDYAAVQADQYFVDELSKRSGGKIKVTLYLNGQLGGAQGALTGIENGTIQGATIGTVWLSGISDTSKALALPFLFTDTKTAMTAYNGAPGQRMAKELDSNGVKLLGWYSLSFNDVMNNSRDVQSMADMKGLKIRVINNPTQIAEYKALGATPIPLDFTEVISGIQSHTLDGAISTGTNSLTLKFYEVAKHYTVLHDSFYGGFTALNANFFKGLPPNYQALIQEVATEAAAKEVDLMNKADDEALAQLGTKGVKVTTLDTAKLDEMKTAMAPIYADAKKQYGDAMVDELLGFAKAK